MSTSHLVMWHDQYLNTMTNVTTYNTSYCSDQCNSKSAALKKTLKDVQFNKKSYSITETSVNVNRRKEIIPLNEWTCVLFLTSLLLLLLLWYFFPTVKLYTVYFYVKKNVHLVTNWRQTLLKQGRKQKLHFLLSNILKLLKWALFTLFTEGVACVLSFKQRCTLLSPSCRKSSTNTTCKLLTILQQAPWNWTHLSLHACLLSHIIFIEL